MIKCLNSLDFKFISYIILIMLMLNVNFKLKFIGEFLIINCKKKKEFKVVLIFLKVYLDRLKKRKKYMDNYY